jgi:hypothetical protein
VKYRKKPVVVEAVQYLGAENLDEIVNFLGKDFHTQQNLKGELRIFIETLEGPLWVTKGDWIIKGVAGEFYPCKPEIFEATYEPA